MSAAILLGGTIVLSLIMMLAWLLQRRWHNCGWVDVVWSFGLGAVGVFYALVQEADSAGPPPRPWPGPGRKDPGRIPAPR